MRCLFNTLDRQYKNQAKYLEVVGEHPLVLDCIIQTGCSTGSPGVLRYIPQPTHKEATITQVQSWRNRAWHEAPFQHTTRMCVIYHYRYHNILYMYSRLVPRPFQHTTPRTCVIYHYRYHNILYMYSRLVPRPFPPAVLDHFAGCKYGREDLVACR